MRLVDPFIDPTVGLRSVVNRYVGELAENRNTADLPILFGPQLSDRQGRWRESIAAVHQRPQACEKLIVEIGCHLGKTLVAMAEEFPETAFAGIDITFKRVVASARKIKRLGLENTVSLLLDARNLAKVFAAKEVDGLVVFYPDPWTKPSKAKHRLLDVANLKTWAEVLKPGGFLWVKTDQGPYFAQICAAALAAGYDECPAHDSPLGRDFSSTFAGHFPVAGLGSYTKTWRKPL